MRKVRILSAFVAVVVAFSVMGVASAAQDQVTSDSEVSDWTAEAAASAAPRDLVIDHRGLGYLRSSDGELTPYGHSVAAESRPIVPRAPGGTPGPPSGGGGGGGDTVTFGQWEFGGQVLKSAGRILFELADGWYVCSGTVVKDDTSDRSVVVTAAHCVYDDVAKEFARSAVFIPNQDDGEADTTDFDCSNDPSGCWILDHGVVDVDWTTRTFPDNIQWDYGYYVVADSGSHSASDLGFLGDLALDEAMGSMALSFRTPTVGVPAHALGYSYNVDPEFMYCKEDLGTAGSDNYWLGRCDMAGGSSGGPWVQPMDETTGDGQVFSVNSWGYTFQSGMAGPKLHGNTAGALLTYATLSDLSTAARGYVVASDGSPPTTTTSTTTVPATGLAAASTSEGKTWTAIVTGPDGLSGEFDAGVAGCGGAFCTLSDIPKRQSSVTFTADEPGAVATQTIIVYKP